MCANKWFQFMISTMEHWIQLSSSCRATSTDIPDPSLATFPIVHHLWQVFRANPYPHIAAECMFVLVVLLLPGHMWASIRVHRLWARPLLLQQCPACLVRLAWIVFVMGGRWPYIWCLVGVVSRTCSILLAAFLCTWRLASSPAVLLASM